MITWKFQIDLSTIMTSIFLQTIISLSVFKLSLSFEPISISLIVGMSAIGGFKFFDQIKEQTYCRYKECCHESMMPFNIKKLQETLAMRLYGQHIVEEKLYNAIASHYKEIEKSEKPLVMSFHGTQGTGKNFVSNLIAEAVFEKGTKSLYYNVIHGSQYDNNERVNEYKEQIKNQILRAIDQCPFSIFIFDEVDKMPEGIFDRITPMLDHHTLVEGRNFHKSVFIFLTNFGGEEITKVLYQLTVKQNIYRHKTELHHFEDINKIGVYNRKGGLKDSALIKAAVIDFYLPFLPLEEKHVVQCIRTEYEKFGRPFVNQDMINEILNYIGFNSVTKFANTGCKTIHPKVKAECL